MKRDLAEVKAVQAENTVTLREHTATLDGLLSIMGAMHSRLSRVEKHLGLVEA